MYLYMRNTYYYTTQHPDKTQELSQEWQQYAQRVGVVEAPVRYKYGQMNCFYDQCIQPEFLKTLSEQK